MRSYPTRRTFFGHAGAALAAPLAAGAALARDTDDGSDLAARLAALEDAAALRDLQQTFARLLCAGAYAEVAALFADPARASIDTGVRLLVPAADADDAVTVAAGGTATARLGCTVEIVTPIAGDGTLVEMARLQGDGFVKRSERRVLASSFVKRNGLWKFEHAELLA
jgi:hypothetical protein